MIWLKEKIKAANALGEIEVVVPAKEWTQIHTTLGNQDDDGAEYLVSQMDLFKESKTLPLHIAQHIYEQLESME